ncbi:MAG: protein kinase [Sandaracinaceae bacterium]|nr:protein kinase [Sandaracinaceae bacterium]
MSPQEPVRLGEYSLLEKLGQGGMAMVYRAERVGEAGFKKKVAIKRMLPAYRRDRSLLERFAAEARTNARLDHPNLVQVVDFGIDPEPYLVMEFVEGVTLAMLLQRLVEQRQPLEISAACFIGAEAAQGSITRTESATSRGTRSASCTATSRRRTCCSRTRAR